MSVESAADRLALIADYGMPVTWQVGAADPVALTALYDSATLPQDLQSSAGLNQRATLTLRAEDLPANAGDETDVIVINTIGFHPKAVMPDGQGMVIVTLERTLS